MNRIYFYKLMADSGAAPCVWKGLLSLAICKPMIRTSASVGDLVFGFAADSLHADNRLIYIAQVTEVLDGGRYYDDARFAGRPDLIYRRTGSGFVRRARALFHDQPGDLEHDLGRAPAYRRARVLVSNDFRYFGGEGSDDYKRRYPRLKRAVEALTQGHRVNHGEALIGELLGLWERVRREAPSAGNATTGHTRRCSETRKAKKRRCCSGNKRPERCR